MASPSSARCTASTPWPSSPQPRGRVRSRGRSAPPDVVERTRSRCRRRPPVRLHHGPPVLSDVLRRRWRLLIPLVVVVVGLGLLGWYWAGSLVPSTYSVMDMGRPDFGGGRAQAPGPPGRGAADLPAPRSGERDVGVVRAPRHESFQRSSGERIDGYTL